MNKYLKFAPLRISWIQADILLEYIQILRSHNKIV